MKIHSVAVNIVNAVNPNSNVLLRRFDGVTQNAHYEKVAAYIDIEIKAQVQALTSSQLEAVNYLNITGESLSIITKDVLQAGSHAGNLAGDIIVYNGKNYLVVMINETFHDHTSAIMVKQ